MYPGGGTKPDTSRKLCLEVDHAVDAKVEQAEVALDGVILNVAQNDEAPVFLRHAPNSIQRVRTMGRARSAVLGDQIADAVCQLRIRTSRFRDSDLKPKVTVASVTAFSWRG